MHMSKGRTTTSGHEKKWWVAANDILIYDAWWWWVLWMKWVSRGTTFKASLYFWQRPKNSLPWHKVSSYRFYYGGAIFYHSCKKSISASREREIIGGLFDSFAARWINSESRSDHQVLKVAITPGGDKCALLRGTSLSMIGSKEPRYSSTINKALLFRSPLFPLICPLLSTRPFCHI